MTAPTQVRKISAFVDESSQFRENEPGVIVGLLTHTSPKSAGNLKEFAMDIRMRMHDERRIKATGWTPSEVIRLAALIRAKGWIVLEGRFDPRNGKPDLSNFAEFLGKYPWIPKLVRPRMLREAESLGSRDVRWLLALLDAVGGLILNGWIPAGYWVFDENGCGVSEELLSSYLLYSICCTSREHALEAQRQYAGRDLSGLFKCSFGSDKESDGLLVADYCAHFFLASEQNRPGYSDEQLNAYATLRRVLTTPGFDKAILGAECDIKLWTDTCGDLFNRVRGTGLSAVRNGRLLTEYEGLVLEWMAAQSFFQFSEPSRVAPHEPI